MRNFVKKWDSKVSVPKDGAFNIILLTIYQIPHVAAPTIIGRPIWILYTTLLINIYPKSARTNAAPDTLFEWNAKEIDSVNKQVSKFLKPKKACLNCVVRGCLFW